MAQPALEILDSKDDPVVADFRQTWSTTPFTTFGYWAKKFQGTYTVPGGNCFNFAIVFKGKNSVTGGRLMCHKDHGNVSIKSKTQDRYYTVDSGVNTPVKYPVPATKKELAFKVKAADNSPEAINKPNPTVKNVDTMYNLTYNTTTLKWGTDHYHSSVEVNAARKFSTKATEADKVLNFNVSFFAFGGGADIPKIKGSTGFKPMLETSEADALKYAETNALGQNATIFLARMLPSNTPGWGLSVFLYFKKSGANDKGTMIINLPKTSTEKEESIKLNVKTAPQTDIDNAKKKLANRIAVDKIQVQWNAQTAGAFDFLLGKLKDA